MDLLIEIPMVNKQWFDPLPTLSLLASAWRTSNFAHRFWVGSIQPMHNYTLMCVVKKAEIWGKFHTRNNFNQIHMNCSWNEESYHTYVSRKWRNPDLKMLKKFMRISRILPALWDWRTERSCSALTLRTAIHPESVEAVYDRLNATKFIPSNFILFSSQKSMWICGGNQWLIQGFGWPAI